MSVAHLIPSMQYHRISTGRPQRGRVVALNTGYCGSGASCSPPHRPHLWGENRSSTYEASEFPSTRNSRTRTPSLSSLSLSLWRTCVYHHRAEGAISESLLAQHIRLSPRHLGRPPLVCPGNLLWLQGLRPKPHESVHRDAPVKNHPLCSLAFGGSTMGGMGGLRVYTVLFNTIFVCAGRGCTKRRAKGGDDESTENRLSTEERRDMWG